ncbi:MAG: hypothetical protein PVF66_02590 [Candidatus Aminicenantes bacterium]|jgi:hypothetical protein
MSLRVSEASAAISCNKNEIATLRSRRLQEKSNGFGTLCLAKTKCELFSLFEGVLGHHIFKLGMANPAHA